jgi:hypothetical protein
MVWRRVLVPASFTLRELHGVIQVTMGWEAIHLYDFQLRAARYGSWEVAAASPDVTLAALRFRKGARFIYEYDLNIPWRHEVRIEDRLPPEVRKTYPVCTGCGGACPPEDGGGPERTESPKGMRHYIHGASNSVNDCGDIFTLASVRISWRIPAVAAATAVHDMYAEVALKRWPYLGPRSVVGGGTMHQ